MGDLVELGTLTENAQFRSLDGDIWRVVANDGEISLCSSVPLAARPQQCFPLTTLVYPVTSPQSSETGDTVKDSLTLTLTPKDLEIMRLLCRHADKHQSTVFYDLGEQWPVFIEMRDKVNELVQKRSSR